MLNDRQVAALQRIYSTADQLRSAIEAVFSNDQLNDPVAPPSEDYCAWLRCARPGEADGLIATQYARHVRPLGYWQFLGGYGARVRVDGVLFERTREGIRKDGVLVQDERALLASTPLCVVRSASSAPTTAEVA